MLHFSKEQIIDLLAVIDNYHDFYKNDQIFILNIKDLFLKKYNNNNELIKYFKDLVNSYKEKSVKNKLKQYIIEKIINNNNISKDLLNEKIETNPDLGIKLENMHKHIITKFNKIFDIHIYKQKKKY